MSEINLIANAVEYDGEQWILFTEVLNAANLSDPKAAISKCEQVPAIERTALPGFDQRERYIRVRDVPTLLGRYRRISPEQTAAFSRILSHLPGDNAGRKSDAPPEENAGNSSFNSASKPERNAPKQGRKSVGNAGNYPWKSWGEYWGEFYASSLVAYIALTGLVVALAVLHASAAWRMLPDLPKWEILALSVLMQSIVLVGTVNANFFKGDTEYRWFLAGFASYDMLMTACNFFYGYDPTVLTVGKSTLPQMIIGVTDLGIRIGFTVGFPLGTIFFASLVKKMRTA